MLSSVTQAAGRKGDSAAATPQALLLLLQLKGRARDLTPGTHSTSEEAPLPPRTRLGGRFHQDGALNTSQVSAHTWAQSSARPLEATLQSWANIGPREGPFVFYP